LASQPAQITPERLLAALAQNPAAVNAPANTVGAGVVEQALKGGGRQNALDFQEDPVSGMRFATYGNVLSPSGVNPSRAAEVVQLRGPNGEDLGFATRGKSGVQPLKTGQVKDLDRYNRLSKQLNTLIAAQAKVAWKEEATAQYQKEIDAVMEQIAGLERGSRTSPKDGTRGGASHAEFTAIRMAQQKEANRTGVMPGPALSPLAEAAAGAPGRERYKLVNGQLQLVQ
jgi:hypothetical protein